MDTKTNLEKKGIIYKIEVNDRLYIGATTSKYLSKRTFDHNYKLKTNPTRSLYKYCIENDINSIKCIPVEDFFYTDRSQLRAREEVLRKQLNATLNTNRAYTTDEEKLVQSRRLKKKWAKENREKVLLSQKKYYYKNKDVKKLKPIF